MSSSTATWAKYDVNEWAAEVAGQDVALTRERPSRYAAGARRGMVEDHGAAWEYSVSIDFGNPIDIAADSLRAAKQQAEALAN